MLHHQLHARTRNPLLPQDKAYHPAYVQRYPKVLNGGDAARVQSMQSLQRQVVPATVDVPSISAQSLSNVDTAQHIGHNDTTYMADDSVLLMHNVPNTNPRVFGEAVWRYMEAVVLGLPEGEIPPAKRDKVYDWLLLTGEYLPCGKCSADFGRRVENNRNSRGKTLYECTTDKVDLLLWVVETQMDVKRGMGKPSCSYKSHYESIARLGTALPLRDKAHVPRKLNLCTPFEVAAQGKSLDTANDVYNIFSFLCAPSPGQFGPFAWAYMVLMLVGAPDRLTEDESAAYTRLLTLTAELLPCCACASHAITIFAESFAEHQPRSRGEFLMWISNVHNKVNARLGKPQVPPIEAARIYTAITQGQSEVNRACAETCPSSIERQYSNTSVWGQEKIPASGTASTAAAQKKNNDEQRAVQQANKVTPFRLSTGVIVAICVAGGILVGAVITTAILLSAASRRRRASGLTRVPDAISQELEV